MTELIDRKYLLAYLDEIKPDEYVSAYGEAAVDVINHVETYVNEMPTIEAEPVRHGRWIQYSRNADETYIECSNCGVASRPRHLQMVTRTGSGLPDYCPNCGADMREVSEDEER